VIEIVVNPWYGLPAVWGVGAVTAWRLSLHRIATWLDADPLTLCEPCQRARRTVLDYVQEDESAAARFACLALPAFTWFLRTPLHRALYGSGDAQCPRAGGRCAAIEEE
jgi:hypothetical protein